MILLSMNLHAQQNLVPNGSFEEITQCPNTISQAQFAVPWMPPPPSSVDLYNACNPGTPSGNPHMGVPSNLTGFQYAHSGNGYVGIYTYNGAQPDGREYLQVKLTEPLEQGKYVVSFWASLADEFQYAVGSIGVYLSDTAITYTGYEPYQLEPSIQSPEGIIMSNKDIWYHITDTFTTRYGGEEYLLLGNFNPAEESDTLLVPTGANNRFKSYYYIDDVSVVALDSVPSSVEDVEIEESNFSVHPNPNSGSMMIQYQLGAEEQGVVRIYTTMGELVFEQSLASGSELMELDVLGISSGIYLLDIQINGTHKLTERLSILRE